MQITLIESGIVKKIKLQNVIIDLENNLRELKNISSKYRLNNTIVITFCDDLIYNYIFTKILYKLGFIHLPMGSNLNKNNDNFINEIEPIVVIKYDINKKLSFSIKKNFCILKVKKQRPYLCSSTSGTTGKSKIIIFGEDTKKLRAKQIIELFKIDSSDTVFCSSPYTHSLGQRLIHVAMNSNANIVYINKFNKKDFINAFVENNVTLSIPISTHLEICQDKLYRTNDHRIIISSSASLSNKIRKSFMEKFGEISYEMYGLSELGTCTLTRLNNQITKTYMGEPVKGCELKIINEKDKNLIAKEGFRVGRIAAYTKWSFLGYVIDKKFIDSKLFLKDNFFITDDYGYLDNKNILHFISRNNDIIKVGGYKVSCMDIKERLSRIDQSINLFITSVKMQKIGDAICCAILNSTNKNIVNLLREYAIANLESYMRPVIYKEYKVLPLLDNGKINVHSIKNDFSKLLGQ